METLAQLHKTYVRPVLYYGLDAIFLSARDKKRLKSYESKTIKLGLGLSTRLQSKLLMHSLGMDDFNHRYRVTKLNFYSRVINHDYTRAFIKALTEEYHHKAPKNSVLFELSQETIPGMSIFEIGNKCKIISESMKREFKNKIRKDTNTLKLKELLRDAGFNKDDVSAMLLAF